MGTSKSGPVWVAGRRLARTDVITRVNVRRRRGVPGRPKFSRRRTPLPGSAGAPGTLQAVMAVTRPEAAAGAPSPAPTPDSGRREAELAGAPAIIRTEALTKIYAGTDFRAVDELDLVVHAGEI